MASTIATRRRVDGGLGQADAKLNNSLTPPESNGRRRQHATGGVSLLTMYAE
jgi:hypothetical protein